MAIVLVLLVGGLVWTWVLVSVIAASRPRAREALRLGVGVVFGVIWAGLAAFCIGLPGCSAWSQARPVLRDAGAAVVLARDLCRGLPISQLDPRAAEACRDAETAAPVASAVVSALSVRSLRAPAFLVSPDCSCSIGAADAGASDAR